MRNTAESHWPASKNEARLNGEGVDCRRGGGLCSSTWAEVESEVHELRTFVRRRIESQQGEATQPEVDK